MSADSKSETTPEATRLADYQVPAFLIDSVDLTFELGEAETRVASRLSLRRNPQSAADDGRLDLAGEALELVSLTLDGEPLSGNRYQLTPQGLSIFDVGQNAVLEIETRIKPQENTELSGLYKSGGNFCTQCEAEGFRRITYFLDRPDVMARYRTTIKADPKKYPVLLSNGNPVAQGLEADGRHWARWEDPHPKPSYLFALVAGDLVAHRDSFTTRSGKVVPLAIYVRKGDEDKCAHAMASLKRAMAWDETVFGLEYDLDVFNIVAVSDFNMGAMENKGLNVFNTKYVLAKPETATDTDYQGIEGVIGHEYFHNWTGDRVTCRDWFQLSLKEGLTVFRDQEFSADQNSRAVCRIGDVRSLRARQFPEDEGPLAHPVRPGSYIEINNFYTATVYEKGAEVVRMIHTLLGAENFRKGMDLYFARHDNHAVTIEDFVAAMQDASDIDLSGFKLWYAQAGTPELTVSELYRPNQKTYELTLRQKTPPSPGQPEKRPFTLPVAVGLLDGKGRDMPVRFEGEATARSGTRVLTLSEAEQTFRFVDVPERPVPSLLRGFSAPVKLKGQSLDELVFLAAHDSDPFSRWEAGQRVALNQLLALAGEWRRSEALSVDNGVIEALASTLAGAEDDPAFAAEALSLPGETAIVAEMPVIDVEATHAARQYLRQAIGRKLGGAFADLHRRLTDEGPHRSDPQAMGRRALRNVCLGYLTAEGGAKAISLLEAQVAAGRNMTDVLAALALLGEIDGPARERAFQTFYEQWRQEDLVVGKWFALQATSSLPDTLVRCKRLLEHPAFDWKNPNRIYSLIGAFSQANLLRFHAADGAGYDFLADQIIRIDPANATVAARLVGSLGVWRRYDAARQALMKRALERILAAPKLSKGTFEMASRSLA